MSTERAARPRLSGVLLAAGLAAVVAGCTALDDMLAAVPFLTFMRESPAFDPYEAPRNAPPNSVPFGAPNGDVPRFGASVAGLDSLAAAVAPVAAFTPDQIARGQVLYDRYCSVCHGAQGAGDGPVIGPGKFPFAPSLHLPITVQRTDGYVYAVIRQGRGLMPSYGERLTHDERWYVVGYLRQLQQAVGAQAGAAATMPSAAADTAAAATSPGRD
ncbi:MAG: c-type cytochrome [Longimicrobiales bacterium]